MQELLYSSSTIIPIGFILAVYSIVLVLSQDFFNGTYRRDPRDFVFSYRGLRADRLRFLIRVIAAGLFWFLSLVGSLLVAHDLKLIALLPDQENLETYIRMLISILSFVLLVFIAYTVMLYVSIRSGRTGQTRCEEEHEPVLHSW